MRSVLLAAIEEPGPAAFNEFARRLRENPSLMPIWNRYVQKHVADHVSEWAAKNHVSEECWSAGQQTSHKGLGNEGSSSKAQNFGPRAELYNFLDRLPIEDLLQLRVPLGWVLKVIRDKG